MRKLTWTKIKKHFLTIHTHRKYVQRFCNLADIPWRGFKHDLSKYSPIEFFESARYYTGFSSPINEAKKDLGISYAWLHHKGKNKHHYEYWMDNFDDGGIARLMPCKDFVEMVCDYLGAAAAYGKGIDDKFYQREFEWWKQKRNHCSMHVNNKQMLDIIFSDFAFAEKNKELDYVRTPEQLIASGYLQNVWKANSNTALF